MMDGILQSLHEVEGVQASLVVDATGQLLAHRAHALYEPALLRVVGRTMINAIASIQLLHQDWEVVTATFADGKILMRRVTVPSTHPGDAVTLALVADARLNPSFASVAIRVAASRLTSLLAAPAAAAAAAGGGSGGFYPPAASVDLSMVVLPSKVGAIPGSSAASPLPLVSPPPPPLAGEDTPPPVMTAQGLVAADQASAAFLVACTRALAGSVGPMAKVFVKEAVRALCGEQPFSRAYAAELVSALAAHIEDGDERAQFHHTMSAA